MQTNTIPYSNRGHQEWRKFHEELPQIFCYFMVTLYKIEKISSFDFLKYFTSGRNFVGKAIVQRLPNISVWRPLFLYLTFITFKAFVVFCFCIYFLCFVQFSFFSSFAEFHGQWELAELLAKKNNDISFWYLQRACCWAHKNHQRYNQNFFTVWTLCRSSPTQILVLLSQNMILSFSSELLVLFQNGQYQNVAAVRKKTTNATSVIFLQCTPFVETFQFTLWSNFHGK